MDLARVPQQVFAYDAYGQLLAIWDGNGTLVSGAANGVLANAAIALTTLLYNGEQFDARIGQQYLRARWYDPATGRFNLMDDPGFGDLTNPQSLHRYLYVHADPINGMDPSGHVSISTVMTTVSQISFHVARLAIQYAPIVSQVTRVIGAVWVASAIQLVLEMYGFVPQTGYTNEIVAISGLLFTAGLSLQALAANTQKVVVPVRNTVDGQLITGRTANARAVAANPQYASTPPYKPASLATEGNLSAGNDLVRVYNPAVNAAEGAWLMRRQDIQGLSPIQIRDKWSLPYTPTHVVDVEATSLRARLGIAGAPFGGSGGGLQIQLLDHGATFTNARPLPWVP